MLTAGRRRAELPKATYIAAKRLAAVQSLTPAGDNITAAEVTEVAAKLHADINAPAKRFTKLQLSENACPAAEQIYATCEKETQSCGANAQASLIKVYQNGGLVNDAEDDNAGINSSGETSAATAEISPTQQATIYNSGIYGLYNIFDVVDVHVAGSDVELTYKNLLLPNYVA